jgi:hypothetical protein
MTNTHILCRARQFSSIAVTTLILLMGTQVNASTSQGRLLVSVTVVEMCHLNLNSTIQAQQLNKLFDATKTSTCEAPRAPVATNSSQPSTQSLVNVDTFHRGLFNIVVDETAGQMTVTF